jgi:competence protein ComEC
LSAKIRSAVSDIFYERLDASSSALSVGLLTGDTSLISAETVRDFRRAGLSHVLAVSGLHLAVILGALDLLLKKLYVKKSIRCVLFSFIALFILFLSGFSASAVRSVLMLLLAYLSFATSRDHDALTSLSAVGALILLIPGSATSVSFWLSFLSTLGLVSWYSVLSSLTERSKGKKRSKSLLWRLLKKAFAAIAVTLVANASICLVLWLVFGEISTISLITNLIITPLCSLYLILTLVVFVLGAIPFLCELLSLAATALCTLISALASFFSHLDISVVSLRYSFAGIIIVLGTISLLVLLIVKLKRKIFVLIPPVASAVCFCICLAIHPIVATDTNVIYTSTERGDILTLTEKSSATIIDASNGSYATLYDAYSDARVLCVTEIERIILTDYYEKHISTLDSFMRTAMVRTLYLPEPTDSYTLLIATDILRSARSLGVEAVIYKKESIVELDGKMKLLFTAAGDKSDLVFAVSNEDGSLTYTDKLSKGSYNTELKKLLCQNSDMLVLGERKPSAATDEELPYKIIIPSDTTLPALKEQSEGAKVLIAKKKDERISSCIFKLGE